MHRFAHLSIAAALTAGLVSSLASCGSSTEQQGPRNSGPFAVITAPPREPTATRTATPTQEATSEPTAADTPESSTVEPETPKLAPIAPTRSQGAATAEPAPIAPAGSGPGTLTEGELRSYAAEAGWPDYLHGELTRVVWCESRYNANSRNGYHAGLLQISQAPNATIRGSWFAYMGIDDALWADPVVNLRVGYLIYVGHGEWRQWVCKP